MDDILLRRLAANASVGGYGTFDMLFMSHISIFVQSFSFYLIISHQNLKVPGLYGERLRNLQYVE